MDKLLIRQIIKEHELCILVVFCNDAMNTKTIEHGRKQDLKGGYADIRQISPERRLVCDPFGASGCEAFACIHKICFRRATSSLNFHEEDDLSEERKKEEGGGTDRL